MAKKSYFELSPTHLVSSDGRVEAKRFYKMDGAAFSGWIVSSTYDSYSYSDAIPTKQEAIRALLSWMGDADRERKAQGKPLRGLESGREFLKAVGLA